MENTKLKKKKRRKKDKLPKVKDEILISREQKYLSPLFFSSFCFITNVISTFEKNITYTHSSLPY
jgi:hypothetical protein